MSKMYLVTLTNARIMLYWDSECVASYTVELLRPFDVLKIGCQCWTVDEWRHRWKAIARNHDVKITQEQVDELLKRIEGQAQC